MHANQILLSDEALKQAEPLPTPNLSDAMGKIMPACVALKPMHRLTRPMIGRALTVRVPPGDNLFAYKAIASATRNDVIVIDAGGVLEQAIIGEIMTTLAASRGVAGIVVHGAIRDIDIVSVSEFPVFACGYTYRGPYRDGPGEINVPVALAGMPVAPGDLVVGDANGVVVVPHADVGQVLETARRIKEREIRIVEQIELGDYDLAWIDQALRERGHLV
ncbi:RraA family protein (plasmid) [Caballeronia sp. NK8]|uniref:RraA family protein n=1 Tax=Caballeronia sp. NK8 TaxID=140098 RepID=UPI001BB7B61B|nr:RraA family protein [Caballeronia sp. NK8]BCQ28148.1 RraA family protein [Caballeronia sp. NK8]